MSGGATLALFESRVAGASAIARCMTSEIEFRSFTRRRA
jgi:hypothetical protein